MCGYGGQRGCHGKIRVHQGGFYKNLCGYHPKNKHAAYGSCCAASHTPDEGAGKQKE